MGWILRHRSQNWRNFMQMWEGKEHIANDSFLNCFYTSHHFGLLNSKLPTYSPCHSLPNPTHHTPLWLFIISSAHFSHYPVPPILSPPLLPSLSFPSLSFALPLPFPPFAYTHVRTYVPHPSLPTPRFLSPFLALSLPFPSLPSPPLPPFPPLSSPFLPSPSPFPPLSSHLLPSPPLSSHLLPSPPLSSPPFLPFPSFASLLIPPISFPFLPFLPFLPSLPSHLPKSTLVPCEPCFVNLPINPSLPPTSVTPIHGGMSYS